MTPSQNEDNPLHFGRAMLRHWALEAGCTYLNHGTVGCPPKRALEAQQRIRDEIERQPSRFLLRELSTPHVGGRRDTPPRLRQAASEVAEFFGARADDLVFTDNATTAINAVLRSFDFRPGDEILIHDHAYGAVRYTADYVARVSGAVVRPFPMPRAPVSTSRVVEAVEAALSPRTRMLLIDHVTSGSALVLPVAAIAERCRVRGVPVLVDGAHATGAFRLDIPSLKVDWYTGNLHKWAWSPRSCAILWVDPSRHAQVHPTTISWGLDRGLSEEFDWVGTRDPSPYLAAPAGLAFMRELGLDAVFGYNHDLAWQAGQLLAECWGSALNAPRDMIGTMLTIALPEAAGTGLKDVARLRDALLFEEQIEVQLHERDGRIHARISAQVYNELADVQRLADAVLARI